MSIVERIIESDGFLGWTIGGGLVLCIGLIVFGLWGYSVKYTEFMTECMQDHKKYECEALWNSTQPQTVIINTR